MTVLWRIKTNLRGRRKADMQKTGRGAGIGKAAPSLAPGVGRHVEAASRRSS
jgi:hypothetical protein